MEDNDIMRAFCVDPTGHVTEIRGEEAIMRLLGVSFALSAALDVLQDAEMMNATRVKFLADAEKCGHDPEALARKIVRLSRALQRSTMRE